MFLSVSDLQVAGASGAHGEKRASKSTYPDILRSRFAVDEEGRVADFKVNVRPRTTADLAPRLIQVSLLIASSND